MRRAATERRRSWLADMAKPTSYPSNSDLAIESYGPCLSEAELRRVPATLRVAKESRSCPKKKPAYPGRCAGFVYSPFLKANGSAGQTSRRFSLFLFFRRFAFHRPGYYYSGVASLVLAQQRPWCPVSGDAYPLFFERSRHRKRSRPYPPPSTFALSFS